MIFTYAGYIIDNVIVCLLPYGLPEFCERISFEMDSIDRDMLGQVWQEFYFRTEECRVSKRAHILRL